MRNLKFPEIDKKIQQSIYGAWGGSNSNEPPPIDGGWLDNVNVGPSGGSSGGSGGYGSGGSWDFGDNGFYDNGGYWGDPGGSGGGSSDAIDNSAADGILEDPNVTEILWLLFHTTGAERDQMRHNVAVAEQYAKTQPGGTDGQGDALRHALWSALDAADIGLVRAREFHELHEASNPQLDGSNAMDLHNNNWGFSWFSQNGNPDGNMYQFMVDFFTAVNNGQIQTHL
ncbi:hypothetical protein Flavo103_36940 [Flavobacterium collinsii]|uniref:DUF6973 domain-containing protein n=1 Tax=Flavobacterium collinsii TaxID=1114861 RepID=UPI0022C0E9FE|nr:hypothetical protein [Flavobacterium collinsii]GIQ60558.1 hypothetical protein Flavo103_36940 [Flavobacterium collinsii]